MSMYECKEINNTTQPYSKLIWPPTNGPGQETLRKNEEFPHANASQRMKMLEKSCDFLLAPKPG